MKALTSPIPRVILGIVFFGIALLDAAMRTHSLSFIGWWSVAISATMFLSLIAQKVVNSIDEPRRFLR